MSNEKLTSRQAEVLAFIAKHHASTGLTPTRREIADYFGWSSANAAEDMVKALAKKGHLLCSAQVGKWRSIRYRMESGEWSPEVSMPELWRASRRRSPSFERVNQLLEYDKATGQIRWREGVRGSNRGRMAGRRAGNVGSGGGYSLISIDGKLYASHRVAYLLGTGEWPRGHVDHINGKRQDNRLENLRDVSRAVNAQNRVKPCPLTKSGALGVVWNKGKWESRITTDGSFKYLGRYVTVEEASAAYFKAKAQLHDGFVPSRLQEIDA